MQLLPSTPIRAANSAHSHVLLEVFWGDALLAAELRVLAARGSSHRVSRIGVVALPAAVEVRRATDPAGAPEVRLAEPDGCADLFAAEVVLDGLVVRASEADPARVVVGRPLDRAAWAALAVAVVLNGLAIAVIELKRSSVEIADGVRQLITNQEEIFNKGFFSTVQLLLAGSDSQGLRYGTTGTPEQFFVAWKDEAATAGIIQRLFQAEGDGSRAPAGGAAVGGLRGAARGTAAVQALTRLQRGEAAVSLGQDSFALAIAHQEADGVLVLDCVREKRAPFSPDAVVKEFAAVLKEYGCMRVVGDRFGGGWPADAFLKAGVLYEVSERTKSDIYGAALPLLNSGRVALLDEPRLRSQLLGLERRTSRGGRDSIDPRPAWAGRRM